MRCICDPRSAAGPTAPRSGSGTADGEPLTEGEVLLAARIEDAYRAVTED